MKDQSETALERAYRLGEGLHGLDAAGVKKLVEMSRESECLCAVRGIAERHVFLDPPVVGERVRTLSYGFGNAPYRTEAVGVYEGVVRSEWDGEPEHFFTDGAIGDTPQTCFGFPAPGREPTTDRTPSQIIARYGGPR